jgi:hypothetical protein
MKKEFSNEKNYDQFAGGNKLISPFPIQKKRLIKNKVKTPDNGQCALILYAEDAFRLAYIKCKNPGVVRVLYYDLNKLKNIND